MISYLKDEKQISPTLLFYDLGLGKLTILGTVGVQWFTGSVQMWENLAQNRASLIFVYHFH